jgi:hypothetical protein
VAGQEGFEPPTPGFGVRCSTVRATGLQRDDSGNQTPARPDDHLFRFLMGRVFSTKWTVFIERQFVRRGPLILGRRIITAFAFTACQRDNHSHVDSPSLPTLGTIAGPMLLNGQQRLRYSMMSLTTPAPTVRPPSRMAKRNSFSIAIGVISSADMAMLSPGMTISTPSDNDNTPVTSVVRK